MTERERFIKTLKREVVPGRVPHFELVFYLTMEVLGKVHPEHRKYTQWNQMSATEKNLHIGDMADCYIDIAKKYHHSAIFVHPNPSYPEEIQRLLENIREKTGNTYYIMMHGDPTFAIPGGDTMMDFTVRMYEDMAGLKKESEENLQKHLALAEYLDKQGHLLDGFALCSDYCFNVNPFFTPEVFGELIAPFLQRVIAGYRDMGYYSIKHTDGNIMPILEQMVQCGPDALHSLDPQGGVSLGEVQRLYGDKLALVGNVNCGLLQTGSDEQCDADVRRALQEGMAAGKGYIFSTSNCVYTGLPLSRYERMHDIWWAEGIYKA